MSGTSKKGNGELPVEVVDPTALFEQLKYMSLLGTGFTVTGDKEKQENDGKIVIFDANGGMIIPAKVFVRPIIEGMSLPLRGKVKDRKATKPKLRTESKESGGNTDREIIDD